MIKCLSIFLFSASFVFSYVGQTPYTLSRVELKYHDHRGVGYNQGYTSLALFLAPNTHSTQLIFADVRAHLFNDAHIAANAGLGLRFYDPSQTVICGLHAFYDVRNKGSFFSQQLSAGMEILTPYLDIRLNGYQPIIGKYDDEPITFSRFKENGYLLKQKVHYAIPMAEMEIGMPLPEPFSQVGLYFALGGYYLFKQRGVFHHTGETPGVKAKLMAHPDGIFSFGAEVSHDRFFGTRANGFVALHIPFGKVDSSDKERFTFLNRKTASVSRSEIIPFYSKKQEFLPQKLGIEPAAILFVNNQSLLEPLGTFEQPYQNLKEAFEKAIEGDTIYVFAADPYEGGLHFKEGLKLLGSGHGAYVSNIWIPAHTPGRLPLIQSKEKDALSWISVNNAYIEGIHLESNEGRALCIEKSSGSVKNCVLSSFSDFPVIALKDHKDKIVIEYNQIESLSEKTSNPAVYFTSSQKEWKGGVTFSHNQIFSKESKEGLLLENVFDEINIDSNCFISESPERSAIKMIFSDLETSLGSVRIKNNTIEKGFFTGAQILARDHAFVECDFSHNQFTSSTLHRGIVYESKALEANFFSRQDTFNVEQEAYKIAVEAREGSVLLSEPHIFCKSPIPTLTMECKGEGKVMIQKPIIIYPDQHQKQMENNAIEALMGERFNLIYEEGEKR